MRNIMIHHKIIYQMLNITEVIFKTIVCLFRLYFLGQIINKNTIRCVNVYQVLPP